MRNSWKIIAIGAFLQCIPARAVIIQDPSGQASYYGIPDMATNPFNGIAQIVQGNTSCTGFAISSTTVLTAAHCVLGSTTPIVTFWVNDGTPGNSAVATSFSPNSFQYNPAFDVNRPENGFDIAVLRFNSGVLPGSLNTYPIYQSQGLLGLDFELFGRGLCGTALGGVDASGTPCADGNDLHAAANRYDEILNNRILLYDFVQTSATTRNVGGVNCPVTSALCDIYGTVYADKDLDPKIGAKEGIAIYGDSGGPSLVNVGGTYFAVGLHSFVGCTASPCVNPPDAHLAVNGRPDGSFGELAGDTALILYSNFIFSGEVPEPGTVALMALGLLGIAGFGKKRMLQSNPLRHGQSASTCRETQESDRQ